MREPGEGENGSQDQEWLWPRVDIQQDDSEAQRQEPLRGFRGEGQTLEERMTGQSEQQGEEQRSEAVAPVLDHDGAEHAGQRHQGGIVRDLGTRCRGPSPARPLDARGFPCYPARAYLETG